MRHKGRTAPLVPPGAAGTNPPPHACIHHLLMEQAARLPNAAAILAPGRTPLTYRRLWQQVEEVARQLRVMGSGHNDRVALVLPNGPEMAVAFLAVATAATCAPLNPAYGTQELDAYLVDLQAKALMVQADLDSPARDVARRHGLHLIELSPMREAEAGRFTLTSAAAPRTASHACPTANDVALTLHTAGTTARPKIVPLTHLNLCASAHNIRRALGLAAPDRCLNVMPLFHVHGLIGAMLASLAAGASVVCLPGFSAAEFCAWLATFQPTWYTAVPTIHQAILAYATSHPERTPSGALRFIRSTSAALPPQVLRGLERVFNAPVIEAYGNTEASMITCNPLPPRVRKIGSVGVAAGPDVAIMDEVGRLRPAGESGEIVVRGATVMRGYDNDPEANRRAFRRGWFRTGDRGYFDADGYLLITGRMAESINRGGEKIAPQEVDEVLMDHPAVAQAVSFAVPHPRLGEDVAAAVVLRPQARATAGDIRRFAGSRLAAFKVPQQVLIVDAIPTGPTGKLQRMGLAEMLGLRVPVPGPAPQPAVGSTPRTPLEEVLAGLWAQVLAVDHVSIQANFFAVGGDSILATQLISRVRQALHAEVTFEQFFETPTVAGMASSIEAGSQAALGVQAPPLQAVPRDGALPLSYAQQRLWFLDQLGLSGHAYHLLEVVQLRGHLQVEALARSLEAIYGRHEVLRTTFVDRGGQPHQVIGPATSFPLPTVDLRRLPEGERQARIHALALEEAKRPFDLAHGPLMSATLVRCDEAEHVLLLAMHHIVSDGWSHGVFWRDLAVLYAAFARGKPSPLSPLAIQYADFAHWQRQWLQGEVLEAQLAYWRRQLAGLPMLQLPTDRPRPPIQSFRGAGQAVMWSQALTQALKAFSQQQGSTLFMTLLAAFQTLLHRYSGQDDIAVGTLIANRTRAEIEGLIGFFVNTLVLRTDVSGDPSFRELLARVRDVALGAYSHQHLPFEKLLEELRPPRDLSCTPLFQVLFVLHNTPQPALELPDLTVSRREVDTGAARFDLTLDLWETAHGIRGRFEYNTDVFEEATIARMAGHFHTLLQGIVADPEQRLSRLPLLSAEERHRLLVEWNDTAAAYPEETSLHALFEAQVERIPDAVALVWQNEQVTYRELNRRANQLAHYLQARGVMPEVAVGICLERSLQIMVGLLGILKAGGAYVPLDPAYPEERLAFMLRDAQVPVVLTQQCLLGRLPASEAQMVCLEAEAEAIAQLRSDNPSSGVQADHPAYVIYTSGSTGFPKGVLGRHRGAVNCVSWLWRTYPFGAGEVCCQKTSLSFVDSVWEIFTPLLQGTRTIILPDDLLRDPQRLAQSLAAHCVSRIVLVPSLLQALLDAHPDLPHRLPSLRIWSIGGEVLPVELLQRFQACMPERVLVNHYGLSEAAANSTWHDASREQARSHVPIGRPIANTQMYLLDRHLQPVPIGVPGELYIGGSGLARGYLNQPALTAERFMPHPFSEKPGARLVKTGDLARYRPDGNLEYLGRLDYQVKVRGVRVEPGEIEAALNRHPAVRETVVIARADVPGQQRLVAYVVPARDQIPTVAELRSFLRRTLPDSMLPTAFVWLDALPLTPNGKTDRLALPSPDHARPELGAPFVAPRTPIEQHVAAIWAGLLGLERVGVHDNFFELGGHSLLATQLLSRIRDALHVDVSLVRFFEAPTVAGLASNIDGSTWAEPGQQAPAIVPASRERPLPAAIAQEQIWVIDQVFPDLPLFTISYAMRLTGRLNVATLELSFKAIVQRHEILRTTFAIADGRLVQVIAPSMHLPLTVVDLRALSADVCDAEVQRLAEEEARQPFDLAHGPLLRVHVLQLDESEHLLLVTMHHIISDGWSLGVLAHELAVLYDAFAIGEPSPLPELPIQYADFAHWQRQWRGNAVMEAQLAYWRAQLREPLPALELPTDHPPGGALSFRTARQTLVLPVELCAALRQLSHREGGTLFMTLVAAFKVLLCAYTGQEDLRVATLIANRHRRETEALIGLLVNTVILRTDLSGNPTGREVLQRVRAITLAAYAHQDLPFEDLVQTFEREPGFKRASLSQILVIFQNTMLRPPPRAAHTLSFLEADSSVLEAPLIATTFEVVLMLRESPQGLATSCIYKRDLFDTATITRLLADFRRVLEGLSAQPEQPLSSFRVVGSERGRRT